MNPKSYRIKVSGLLIFFASFSIIPVAEGSELAPIQTSDAPQVNEEPSQSIRSSNTTPSPDDRVAQLWEDEAELPPRKKCTANHLQGNFWITAQHCIGDNKLVPRFIRQLDGDTAKVKSVYTKSETVDIALLKVEDGVKSASFSLPDRSLSPGDRATLVGYGGSHDYPSVAQAQVEKYYNSFSFGEIKYSNILGTVALDDSWSCHGDSGGAIYSDDTIYAVHTAGGGNPTCADRKGGKMWHSDIFPHVDWIDSIIGNS
ncbi:trypsin-like serine protease [uncultured Corynebacterium sp.]|uniref:trypsin-like serine protease n=1 Tax=uncultured Corynebacterium sp. TaxID=159447 RepID=UPI003459C0A8